MATATLTAVNDRVIVEADVTEAKSQGGIYIPDSAQQKPTLGTIRAVGPGRSDTTALAPSMSVKVGDRVFFGKWSGTEIQFNGKDYTVLREDDILAVIR